MTSWHVALVLLLLAACGPAARPPAQTPSPAELVVPVEDLGPDWLFREESYTRDESGAPEFTRRYTFDPGGEAIFTLAVAPDAATADSWLNQRAARFREQTVHGSPLPIESVPGLGDGQAVHLVEYEFALAVYLYRAGPTVVTVVLGLGFVDSAWVRELTELGPPQARWQRYFELLTDQARQYAGMQETRLRLALAGRLPTVPKAQYCGTNQVPRIHERFTVIVRTLGPRVGEPLECVHADPGTLDWVQATSGGQLGWHKAESVPAFSDATTTWLMGPDGLVARPRAGPLFTWEVARAAPTVLPLGTDQPVSLAWSPVGARLAAGDTGGQVRLWDLATSQPPQILPAARDSAVHVSWSPDGKRIMGATDAAVQVWDADSGGERCSVTVNPPRPSAPNQFGPNRVVPTWSPDSRRLALPGWAQPVVPIVDATTCEELLALRGHEGSAVSAAAWSPDGLHLATGAWDGTARVWDAATGRQQVVLDGHPSGWIRVGWSPAGDLLATYQSEGVVRLWDPSTGQNVRSVGAGDFLSAVSWSPNGAWLATGSREKLVIWDPRTGEGRDLGPSIGEGGIAWSPDGSQVAAAYRETQPPLGVASFGTAIWEAATAQRQWLLRDLEAVSAPPFFGLGTVSALAWSSDGRHLVSAGSGTEIRLWDLSASAYGTR